MDDEVCRASGCRPKGTAAPRQMAEGGGIRGRELVEDRGGDSARSGEMTPRTQKITSNLSGGSVFGRSRVRIDVCRIRLYVYDRCRAPAKPRKPSGSIGGAACCSKSISFPKPSNSWRRIGRFLPVRRTAISNKGGD